MTEKLFDGEAWNERQAILLTQEGHKCSFCERAACGGPMATIINEEGLPIYSCEVHFLAVRTTQDFVKRRLAKEKRKWTEK